MKKEEECYEEEHYEESQIFFFFRSLETFCETSHKEKSYDDISTRPNKKEYLSNDGHYRED